MADAPWQPRPLAHREALAALVSRYGPVMHPPGFRETWDGVDAFARGTGRNGGHRCMWCNGSSWNGCSHREGCPVHRFDRLEAIALQIPVAEAAVQTATERLAELLAERDALVGAP